MPLGDSITVGEGAPAGGGYRGYLLEYLTNSGYEIDYVGSMTTFPASGMVDIQHEGHSGWTIPGITSQITKWLTNNTPDVILLMIGTNDVKTNSQSQAPARLSQLIDRIYATSPSVHLFVASIPPFNNSLETRSSIYNNTIPGIVDSKRALGRSIYYVNIHDSLVASEDIFDGIHPNELGYRKIAQTWFEALTNSGVLSDNLPVASSTPMLTDTPSPTATPMQFDTDTYRITIISPSNDYQLPKYASFKIAVQTDSRADSIKMYFDTTLIKSCLNVSRCEVWRNPQASPGVHTIRAEAVINSKTVSESITVKK